MTTTTSSSSTSSLSVPVQPDHFYAHETPTTDKGYFDPNDDPSASRGIPVFRPTIQEFEDFEGYLTKIECWGMKSGIVKIIPPPEWTNLLPSTKPQLKHVKLRNPIEQEFLGSGGLFRQQNIEKRRIMSVREWAEQCKREDMRAPTVEEAQGGRRHVAPDSRASKSRAKRTVKVGQAEEVEGPEAGEGNTDAVVDGKPDDRDHDHDHEHEWDDVDVVTHNETSVNFDVDPASTLPTPPATTASHSPPNVTGSPSVTADNSNSPTSTPATARTRRTPAERQRAKELLDDAFLSTFDPRTDWLPKGMKPEDYTPELCRTLEKMYWRSCGVGKAPWYGADMKGSLFTSATKHWNVATLPSALSRLLGSDSQISGVNTPYLYFGMWRATFAWHVEDMDLFSINYIHFGAPKFWYAMPQSRASSLETTMKGYFPRDISNCPQFLRHKSFLASPQKLEPGRPNVLVQHAGEFVVTFPRGYHAGFNLGFNCAESVNFALESWIELGKKAAYCACIEDSVKIDVGRLLKEREMERNGNGVMTDKGAEYVGPDGILKKKRKVEVVIELPGQGSPSKAKRPKTSAVAPSKSRPKPNTSTSLFPPASISQPVPAHTHFPCCLCPSPIAEGLLRVHDPPSGSNTPCKPPPGTPWRAHELCARVVPETWIDEDPETDGGIEGVKERVVWGVDGIVKDRWMLKCSVCTRPTSKSHGAPIQCAKGKCSKAFHVTCAAEAAASSETAVSGSSVGAGIGYRILEEIEKEVVLIDDVMDVDLPNVTSNNEEVPSPGNIKSADDDAQPSSSLPTSVSTSLAPVALRVPSVIKTIKKLLVEVLCSQHNPASIALKKASKDERLIRDIEELKEMDRIRIRNSSGVFEVSLVQVNKDRRTVEVLWDGGQKREFKWGSIVWSWSGETGKKPTAEEVATNLPPPVPSKSTPKSAASTSSTTQYNSPAMRSAPSYNTYPAALFSFQTQLFEQQRQQGQPQWQGQAQPSPLPPVQHATPNTNGRTWYQGMSQFRVAPQPVTGGNMPSTSSTSVPASTASSTGKVPVVPASTVTPMAIPPPVMPLTPAQMQAYRAYYQPYYQQYALYAAQPKTQFRPFVPTLSSSASGSQSNSTSASTSASTSSTPKPSTAAASSPAVPLSVQARGAGIGTSPYYHSPYPKSPLQTNTRTGTSTGTSTGTTPQGAAPYLQLTPKGIASTAWSGTSWPAYVRGTSTDTDDKSKGKDRADKEAENEPEAQEAMERQRRGVSGETTQLSAMSKVVASSASAESTVMESSSVTEIDQAFPS